MKYILVLFFFLLNISGYSQITKGEFNTKINKAGTVTVKNNTGKIEIIKADTVIIIYNIIQGKEEKLGEATIVHDGPTTQKLYIVNYKESIDSSGLYITTMEFGNIGEKSATDIDIRILFDKPFENCKWEILNSGMSIGYGNFDSNRGTFFFAGMMFAGRKAKLIVTSKERLYTTILGAKGTYNN